MLSVFLAFLHGTALFSLQIKTGALPLGFAVLIVMPHFFMSLFAVSSRSHYAQGAYVIGCLWWLALVVLLQFTIISRLKRLAAE